MTAPDHAATTPGGARVIDLAERTTVRIRRDDSPLATMSADERVRIIVRVLCELVAYGEHEHDAERRAS